MQSLSELCWLVSNQMIQPCPLLSILSFEYPNILELTDSLLPCSGNSNEICFVEWKRKQFNNPQVSLRRLYSKSFSDVDEPLRKWVLRKSLSSYSSMESDSSMHSVHSQYSHHHQSVQRIHFHKNKFHALSTQKLYPSQQLNWMHFLLDEQEDSNSINNPCNYGIWNSILNIW